MGPRRRPMQRRTPVQPSLFKPPAQPRYVVGEPERVYLSVLTLRRRGCRVYRAGRGEHLIDGKRVSTEILIRRAGLRDQ